MADNNGFEEYKKLIMSNIADFKEELKEMNESLTEIKIEIGMLKVKSGIWGLIGACVPVVGGIAWLSLKR